MKKIVWLFVGLLSTAAAVFAQSPLDPATRNVTFPGPDKTTLGGYLARPDGRGPFPGVLLIHEWWGLNTDMKLLADALAGRGFVVLAADAYRGQVGATAQEAGALARGTPQERIRADLDAALLFLRTHPAVDPARVASWGFCFGGTQSMHLGTRAPELAAVVIFYGSGPIAKAEDLGRMKDAGPVLGIYGEQDGGIPVAQVKAFEKALADRGVTATIKVYPGVGHAFVKSTTYNQGGAAQEAWEQAVAFLDRVLK